MIAIYSRVSTKQQDTAAQDVALKSWAALQQGEISWYTDKYTGSKMERPGMDKLLSQVKKGKISKIVVWRLDRLGRSARGLLNFFHELDGHKCGFASLADGIDLDTAAGRLMRTVLAGIAEFELEVRSERQMAGIAAIRESNNGKCTWGGRKIGTRIKVTEEKEAAAKEMVKNNKSIAEISRVLGWTRKTTYSVLKPKKVLDNSEIM